MPFRVLDDVATADIAFQAWGQTLKEGFVASADAVMNVMIENLDSIEPCEEHEYSLQSEALEMLLFDFFAGANLPEGCAETSASSSRS